MRNLIGFPFYSCLPETFSCEMAILFKVCSFLPYAAMKCYFSFDRYRFFCFGILYDAVTLGISVFEIRSCHLASRKFASSRHYTPHSLLSKCLQILIACSFSTLPYPQCLAPREPFVLMSSLLDFKNRSYHYPSIIA